MDVTGRIRRVRIALIVVLALFVATITACSGFWTPADPPESVILFIGDGMGSEQIRAASLWLSGHDTSLSFESFPVRADVSTHSATAAITDSAAAATAMATGRKVQNGAVSVFLPGTGADLTTIVELATAAGMSTGLVTTAFVTHATPAGFAAHVATRTDYAGIASDYLTGSRPNVIFGGGGNGSVVADYEAAGYTVATTAAELDSLVALAPTHAAALIGTTHLPYIHDGRPADVPSLEDLTIAAIDLLVPNPNGFFLMVEAARIDHAGHANDIARMIPEVVELHEVVGAVMSRPDLMAETLVIVTADHETGGLAVLGSGGAGELPLVSWATDGHTAVPVPLYATGPGATQMRWVTDNTEIFERVRGVLGL